jgi:hypothetical protein
MNDAQLTIYASSVFIVSVLVLLLFDSFALWFLTRRFSFSKYGYRYALIIAVISEGLSFVTQKLNNNLFLLLFFIIDAVLVKLIYAEDWRKSFIVSVIWWILRFVFIYISGVILSIFSSFTSLTSH